MDEFEEFLQTKAKEIHDETWRTFRVGMRPNTSWYCAKDKEILIGEVIRKYHEIHCL